MGEFVVAVDVGTGSARAGLFDRNGGLVARAARAIAMNRDGADAPLRVNLEINPRHAVIKRLFETHTANPDRAKLVAEQLLDNALISAGLLDDASAMVARLNKLLETV